MAVLSSTFWIGSAGVRYRATVAVEIDAIRPHCTVELTPTWWPCRPTDFTDADVERFDTCMTAFVKELADQTGLPVEGVTKFEE